MERSISNYFIDKALDNSAATPEGPQADTFYDSNTRPGQPTGEQLQILYAFKDGRLTRDEAEQALTDLDQ